MSALVDRITEVLQEHQQTDEPTWANERVCRCGENVRANGMGFGARPDHTAHVAEQVAAELQLTEERRNFSHTHQDRRWVSAWSEVQP